MWVPGTNRVEVRVDDDGFDGSVEVAYSAGSYTPWGGRRWRAATARRTGDCWTVELPVVDPEREIWFYGHVEGLGGLAASSPVLAVVPGELGVARATARAVPGFDFAAESFWNLPIGDVGNPRRELVEGDGHVALSTTFDDADELRAVVYCLEGDLIAAAGHEGVEVSVRAGAGTDLSRFQIVLVNDYNTLDEQDYGLPLASFDTDFADWTRIRVPFTGLTPYAHRVYHDYTPPARPFDVARISAVGFRRDDHGVVGELSLADIQLYGSGVEVAAAAAPTAGLRIETTLPADELRERLAGWAPWRHEIVFSNGVRTSEFERGPMFVERPIEKWQLVAPHLPLDELRGGRALDVGSNIGQYSIHLRRELGMDVTGLENNPRNLEVARFLVDLAGLDRVRFVDADASVWNESSGLDLVLHFGTLDHLRHPLLALENAARMLRAGGLIALELQTLVRDDDPRLCRYVPVDDTSSTCRWFLGREALLGMLSEAGFGGVEIVLDWRDPDLLGPDMARLVLVARRMAEGETV